MQKFQQNCKTFLKMSQIKYNFSSMNNDAPLKKEKEKIVILGSGWGGYNFSRNIDKEKFDVTLISPRNHFLFTPLLPSTTVGTLEFRCIQEPIRQIQNLNYVQAKAQNIDFKQKNIECISSFKEDSFKIKYDKLIVSVGSKTNTFNTPGIDKLYGESVFFLKQLYHARTIRNRIIECFERASMPHISNNEKKRLLSFVVVGGGPTSCEFTSELHDFLVEDLPRLYPQLKNYVSIHLVEAGPELLGVFDQKLKEYVKKLFNKRNINVKTGISVKSVGEQQKEGYISKSSYAELSNGENLEFGLMIWSAGLKQVDLISSLEMLEKDQQGRISINDNLQIKLKDQNDFSQDIFAIGDCAVNVKQPLPQIAQAAQQQGNYLAKYFNLGQIDKNKPFQLFSLGSMANIGQLMGIYDGTHLGNPYGKEYKVPKLSGFLAFLIWRTGYWGKQVSISNKLLIPMHWFKAFIFGRDISRF